MLLSLIPVTVTGTWALTALSSSPLSSPDLPLPQADSKRAMHITKYMGFMTKVFEVLKRAEGLCESPLERGVGVCPCASSTHPCNRTIGAPPLERGTSRGKTNLSDTQSSIA